MTVGAAVDAAVDAAVGVAVDAAAEVVAMAEVGVGVDPEEAEEEVRCAILPVASCLDC
jgi:hypothetical protein